MRAIPAGIVILVATACGADTAPPLRDEAAAIAVAGADVAPAEIAASRPLPERLGIGRSATAEEIARLDIDVRPDGKGLPPGEATAVEGAPLYAARCAACHGAEGEGTQLAAALAGRQPGDAFDFAESREGEAAKTVGSYWPYAATLFDYIRRAMPFDSPGTLTDHETYALTAWVLWRNGIIDSDAVMDAATLPAVRMPARERFVPDDRDGSDRVR